MNGIICGVLTEDFPVPSWNRGKKMTYRMTPKGVVVHNKEMSLFENLPLIALCALIIIFGVWHVDSFYTLVNNGVNIMMGALK